MVQFKSVSNFQSYRPKGFAIKKMEVHAYGLLHPGHMEFTRDNRLLVSEFGRGRVTDITKPGDYRDQKGLIEGLSHPASIITNYSDDILVVDTGADAVRVFSPSKNTLVSQPLYQGLPAPYGGAVFKDQLLVSYTNWNDNGLVSIGSGDSSFSDDHKAVYGFPIGVSEYPYVLAGSQACGHWTATVAKEKLIFSQTSFGILWDVSAFGKFDTAIHKRFAWGLNKPVGMIFNDHFNLLFVTESGAGTVKAIPTEGGADMRYIPPLVSGLKEPRCVRFAADNKTMFVCDMSACCVWRVELE